MKARLERYTQNVLAEMNITPLVDVMLVLLVIFMITAPVLAHRIPLDLPQGVPDRVEKVPIVVLTVGVDGSYALDGQPLPVEALALQLKLEAKRTPQPELTIDAARAVPYQQIATALAAAHDAELQRIGFKPLD